MERLKQLRKERNLTTTQLGLAVGCSNPAITHYEHGDRKPDPDMLVKLADFFEVSVDYLLGRTNNSFSEFTKKERASGMSNASPYNNLSEDEIEWLELRSELIRTQGEDYLKTFITMIKAVIEKNNK